MAIRSRIKTLRQVKVRTERNKSQKSAYKTFEKKYLVALEAADKDLASAALITVTSALDKMAKVNVIHKSKADRKKSRLTLAFNKTFA